MRLIFKYCTCLLIFIVGFKGVPFAGEKKTNKIPKYSFRGYIKDLRTVAFTDVKEDWVFDNLFHNRLQLKWYPCDVFTFDVELRNRIFYGETVETYNDFIGMLPGLAEQYPTYGTFIDQDVGLVDIAHPWVDQPSIVAHTAIDRLWVELIKGKFQLRFGRQRINWGVNYAWNPHDLFNNYSIIDFDYEERPGTDALRLQIYPGALSQFELAVSPNKDSLEQSVAAVLYKFNKWKYDFQFIAGSFREKLVLGAGWAGSIKDVGFRAEFSYFHPFNDFQKQQGKLVAGLSGDYALKNSLNFVVEVLFNSNYEPQPASLLDLSLTSSGPDELFPAEWAIFGMSGYNLTPLLRGDLSAAWSPSEEFYFLSPSLTLSIKDNLDLALLAQIFKGDFEANPFLHEHLLFVRLKYSFAR